MYQQDAFYELADQYGLMVWEEFMFACSTSRVLVISAHKPACIPSAFSCKHQLVKLQLSPQPAVHVSPPCVHCVGTDDYAVPKPFLDSVAKEVADNVKRLQHHPSIAVRTRHSAPVVHFGTAVQPC